MCWKLHSPKPPSNLCFSRTSFFPLIYWSFVEGTRPQVFKEDGGWFFCDVLWEEINGKNVGS